jgi:O-methyltransferase
MTDPEATGPLANARALYLTLLKRGLLGMLRQDAEIGPEILPSSRPRRLTLAALRRRSVTLARVVAPDPEAVQEGRGWPQWADTMIGRRRLDNLQSCVEDVIDREIPGDLIETGVWRGGACILMRGVLRAHGVEDRRVWVADSFAGLPAPDPDRYPADRAFDLHEYPQLAVSADTVRANFARYGLLDEQVRVLEGWFRDTLPPLAGRPWAVIRLDGDLYESTIVALRALYPGLSPGGYLIVDDYWAVDACRAAVTDYRSEHGIDEEIHDIDGTGVFWQRAPATAG